MTEILRTIPRVKFRNNAGSTAPAGGILRITSFDATTDPEEGFFTVDQPAGYGAQYGHAINDDFDVPAGEYGYCFLGQMVPALYDSGDGTPAFGQMWGPRSGTWKLKKYTGGFQVQAVVDSANNRVLVAPAPMLTILGKLDASVTAGGTQTVSVWDSYGGADLGEDVTVLFFSDAAAGKYVVAEWYPQSPTPWIGGAVC